MRTVAIFGAGLIGGSFGLALKKAGFDGTILGVSSRGALDAALARGAIDEPAGFEEAAGRADLIYLAQPIRRILESLARLPDCARPGCLITDAGSTKAQIVEAGRAIRGAQFLGGHPMAGKEKRGVEVADPDLFAGRTYVLTPCSPEELETQAAREFAGWVRKIGAVPMSLAPAEHDRVVALTSHLPQLLSTALAATLSAELGSADAARASGPGLADMTRLAGSAWEIWADILATNAGPIEAALDAFAARLQAVRAHVRSGGLSGDFESANRFQALLRRG